MRLLSENNKRLRERHKRARRRRRRLSTSKLALGPGKNILIFSDGTGQAGGLRPDQMLSNVYKLYRATRSGPDSPIDPTEQIAFYDPGLGSGETNSLWATIRKYISAGLGTGFTRNVADCYEAILKVYEPGDRIYLFGFSRGAYTVRSLAGVMNLCGVPTVDAEGKPIVRYGSELRKIADEAVHTVYEHGAGRERGKGRFAEEREEQARRFRIKYKTQEDPDLNQRGNVVPYFVGVFDTVASLGSSGFQLFAVWAVIALTSVIVAGLIALASWVIGFPPIISFVGILAVVGIAIGIYLYKTRFKVIRDFPERGDVRWHMAAWRFKHYDKFLDKRIRYGRHAQALDETRAKFDRVGWGQSWDAAVMPKDWLVQVWFAGNHSDIGGSYPENESRLSDIALEWMVGEATSIQYPIKVDRSKLNLWPSIEGIQHCEIAGMLDSYPAWFPRKWRRAWGEKIRSGAVLASCHPTVHERFRLKTIYKHGVPQGYRPETLRHDPALKEYYESGSQPEA